MAVSGERSSRRSTRPGRRRRLVSTSLWSVEGGLVGRITQLRRARRVVVVIAFATTLSALPPGSASAGTYFVYSCSDYGNGAPTFAALTGGTNWTTPNECP